MSDLPRRVTWEDWKDERRGTAASLAGLAERLRDRRDRRTRTDEERRALRRAALGAIRERERSGRLVWVGRRSVRLRVTD